MRQLAGSSISLLSIIISNGCKENNAEILLIPLVSEKIRTVFKAYFKINYRKEVTLHAEIFRNYMFDTGQH